MQRCKVGLDGWAPVLKGWPFIVHRAARIGCHAERWRGGLECYVERFLGIPVFFIELFDSDSDIAPISSLGPHGKGCLSTERL